MARYEAMRLRTVGRFTAARSLARQPLLTEFSLEEYVMMPAGSQQAVDSGMFGHRIGLRSEVDGSERMIPESLYELWKRGQVPADRIPVLAQAIAPRVLAEDFNLILSQSTQRSMLIALLTTFVIVTAVAAFASVDGERMSFPLALLVGAAFSVFVGAIFWIVLQTGRGRRRQQMEWLLSANAGNASAIQPSGLIAGRAKLVFQIAGALLAAVALFVGGFFLWDSKTGKVPATPGPAPVGSGRASDLETTVVLSESEAAAGKTVQVTVPGTK